MRPPDEEEGKTGDPDQREQERSDENVAPFVRLRQQEIHGNVDGQAKEPQDLVDEAVIIWEVDDVAVVAVLLGLRRLQLLLLRHATLAPVERNRNDFCLGLGAGGNPGVCAAAGHRRGLHGARALNGGLLLVLLAVGRRARHHHAIGQLRRILTRLDLRPLLRLGGGRLVIGRHALGEVADLAVEYGFQPLIEVHDNAVDNVREEEDDGLDQTYLLIRGECSQERQAEDVVGAVTCKRPPSERYLLPGCPPAEADHEQNVEDGRAHNRAEADVADHPCGANQGGEELGRGAPRSHEGRACHIWLDVPLCDHHFERPCEVDIAHGIEAQEHVADADAVQDDEPTVRILIIRLRQDGIPGVQAQPPPLCVGA
mmetsp:Transcript_83782/g.261754  ORF Transcript_83782/g.261754 Transcript_83782/m.261754 type:complete len:370 (-) Transcript_83782:168-1277(-)